jgi:hypothetical protein
MNRIQKSIIATWVAFAAVTFCLIKGWWFAGYLFPSFLALVRWPYIDDSRKCREYAALKKGRSLAIMVSTLVPAGWFVFRLFSTPRLPDSIWWELVVLGIPYGISLVGYERWLYSSSTGLRTARHHVGQ